MNVKAEIFYPEEFERSCRLVGIYELYDIERYLTNELAANTYESRRRILNQKMQIVRDEIHLRDGEEL